MAVSSKPTSQCTAHTFVDAVKSGCLDSVLRHIDAGLDLNVGPTPDWATPLMVAGNRGHEAIVRQLLKAGADVNHARTNGVTALMCAAQNGRTTTVQALLEHGAAIDLADTYGSTALMYASRANNTFCVRLLLQAGANCRLKHRHDGTAMSIAIAHGNNQVIKLLRAHEALTSSPRKDLFQHLFG